MDDTKPNRPPWENQWQQAFDGAETPPSEHVWKNIEGQLAVQESGKYRRGFLLYRAVAAVLLLLIAGLSWYILAQRPAEDPGAIADAETQQHSPRSADERAAAGLALPDTNTTTPKVSPAESLRVAEVQSGEANRARPALNDAANATGLASATESAASATSASLSSALVQSAVPPSGALAETDRSLVSTDQQRSATASLVASVTSGGVADASAPQLPDQSEAILYRVPQIPMDYPEKEREPIAFFAGLSLAPGYFDPQFQANPGNLEAVALGPSPSSSFNAIDLRSADAYGSSASSSTIGIENTPELSFSYGFDVGMRLSEHWVLEGGVDYNRFVTSTASRWVVADIASGERYAYVATNANTLDNNMNQSPNTSTDLNNGYEFIAVPMKVGYRRFVNKFQFTLSSGVAANFFLQNAISAANDASQLRTYRISASEEGSPFNNVYYSGLLSGGVNYNVSGRYFLSLTPTYTFALTPLTRADSDLSSNPYSLGVNVGFQYQF
ncbi:MAG: hypothetical protein WA958_14470 [Tunicatimonas sp.]